MLSTEPELEVIRGALDLNNVPDEARRRVNAIRIHEDYDPFSLNNDIALLFLDGAHIS